MGGPTADTISDMHCIAVLSNELKVRLKKLSAIEVICTGWPFTLFPPSCRYQNKSPISAHVLNTIFVLVLMGGWEQHEWSPCTIFMQAFEPFSILPCQLNKCYLNTTFWTVPIAQKSISPSTSWTSYFCTICQLNIFSIEQLSLKHSHTEH